MVTDVVVVGAGITGLAAARRLQRAGVRVILLEASQRVGGNLRSWRDDQGVILEAGPNSLSVTDQGLFAHLVGEGLEDAIVTPDAAAARRYVVMGGKPVALPSGPADLFSTPLLSWRARVRLFSEPFRRRGTDPEESVRDFTVRRLGPEPAERFVDPFVSGIHAGDPAALSVRAAFPTLWEAEQGSGSLLRGMIRKRREARGAGEATGSTPGIMSLREGLGMWPARLAAALGGDRIRTGCRVVGIEGSGAAGWEVETSGAERIRCSALILAVPAHEAARLVAPMAPDAFRALDAIPYAPVAVVHHVYRREDVEHPLDGFGLLCPGVEGRRILGSLWLSTLFPGRVPGGQVLTTTFVGGARAPDRAALPDDALAALVREEQADLLGAGGSPRLAGIVRWPRAIPQYVRGHVDRIARAAALEAAHPGLHLVGNWRDGVGVPASWAAGERVGRRVAEALGSTPAPV